MKFDFHIFSNNVGILRFTDEEFPVHNLTLSSTQNLIPHEFCNDSCEDVTEQESTVTNNESKVELLFMFP